MRGGRRRAAAIAVILVGVVALLNASACSSTGSEGATGPGSTAPVSGPAGTEPNGTTAPACDLPEAGTHTVEVVGVPRTFDVYPPASGSVRAPVPTLVLFHGFNSSKEEMVRITGLADQAPEAGVLLVVPQGAGSPAGWNVLTDFDQDRAFTDALLAELDASSCVADGDRWLAGFSAGSAFAAVYGCANAAAVTGLGLVAALAPAICPPDDTPNVVITHGSADPVVPFAGGDQAVGETKVPLGSVTDSATTWATRAGCGPTPVTAAVGDDVAITRWTGCAGGSSITFQVVDGGGHSWPGAVSPVAIGRTTQTISESCVLLAAIVDLDLDPYPDCPGDGPPQG